MPVRSTAPTRLLCNSQHNPTAIYNRAPHLSWLLPSNGFLAEQSAYEILVSSTAEFTEADLWSSGKVQSEQSLNVPYLGKLPPPTEDAFWKVRVWNEKNEVSEWSEVATWTMGFRNIDHWRTYWIYRPASKWTEAQPPSRFRKVFKLDHKQLKRARLAFVAKGLCQVFLNGKAVHPFRLGPDWSDYHRHFLYHVVDVTDLIKPRDNVIAIEAADGWFCGEVCWFGRNRYGAIPGVAARLALEFTDGPPQLVISDSSWRCSSGPIRKADLIQGEQYDAGSEQTGWNDYGFDDSKWERVMTTTMGNVDTFPAEGDFIQELNVQKPVSVSHNAGALICDFGTNEVGVLRIAAKPERDEKLVVRHAEVLDKGALYTTNLRGARQQDEFVLKAGKDARLEPQYTFHGFRYAEIKAENGSALDRFQVERVNIGTAYDRTLRLEVDHPKLQMLWHNIERSMQGNFVSVPTDCPQRDERLGWLGDIQVFAPTACLLGRIDGFLSRWMRSVCTAQEHMGVFPNIAPQQAEMVEGAPGWADAGIIVPWTVYRHFRHTQILEDSFDSIRGHLETLLEANPNFLWENRRSHDFADWLAIGEECDKTLIASAYLAHSLELSTRIAKVIGRLKHVPHLVEAAAKSRAAFRKKYIRGDHLSPESQTAYVLALSFSLFDRAEMKGAANRLAELIKARNEKLTTGFLGVNQVLQVLRANGHAELTHRLLLSETYPSWLYPINHGATSIWERWDGWTEEKGFQDPGMNSFNHYAYGAVGQFMVECLAGLRNHDEIPAFREFYIEPDAVEGIQNIKMEFDSPYGLIAVNISRAAEVVVSLTVPPNTKAHVNLKGLSSQKWRELRPVGKAIEKWPITLTSGNYEFAASSPVA